MQSIQQPAPSYEEDFEKNDFGESDDSSPITYSITSYSADYPVDSLVKRINSGAIYILSFQRGYVWKIREASRFIESLLLGLPVPGVFMAREKDTNKLLVIDGQQRLRTIQYFYNGTFEPAQREFILKSVAPQFENRSYRTLSEEDRIRLDDSIILVTIIQQDEPSEDDSSIYHVFERLNTSGVKLNAQEIRAAIYHGEFNDLLVQLNKNPDWRNIYSIDEDERMRDKELILRFLVLYFEGGQYKKPLKNFLNGFMGRNRNLTIYSAEAISNAFSPTIKAIYQGIGQSAFKPTDRLNAAVFDAVMVGIAKRLEKGSINDCNLIRQTYLQLLENQEFKATTTETARTTEVTSVRTRLQKAIEAFNDIE